MKDFGRLRDQEANIHSGLLVAESRGAT